MSLIRPVARRPPAPCAFFPLARGCWLAVLAGTLLRKETPPQSTHGWHRKASCVMMCASDFSQPGGLRPELRGSSHLPQAQLSRPIAEPPRVLNLVVSRPAAGLDSESAWLSPSQAKPARRVGGRARPVRTRAGGRRAAVRVVGGTSARRADPVYFPCGTRAVTQWQLPEGPSVAAARGCAVTRQARHGVVIDQRAAARPGQPPAGARPRGPRRRAAGVSGPGAATGRSTIASAATGQSLQLSSKAARICLLLPCNVDS